MVCYSQMSKLIWSGLQMDIRDQLIKRVGEDNSLCFELWEPESTFVVLGRSQKAEEEVNLAECHADQIPVLKRRGGGGAVVLMPGVLCITIAFYSEKSDSPYYFFKQINRYIISVLSGMLITGLTPKGISDIAINDKKILGCSMFKSRKLFLYQGSLLVNPQLEKICRYLKHPSREPDYRKRRTHLDFTTSLQQAGYFITLEDCRLTLMQEMNNALALLF